MTLDEQIIEITKLESESHLNTTINDDIFLCNLQFQDGFKLELDESNNLNVIPSENDIILSSYSFIDTDEEYIKKKSIIFNTCLARFVILSENNNRRIFLHPDVINKHKTDGKFSDENQEEYFKVFNFNKINSIFIREPK